jgi:short-subunit dehydrogenase
MWQGRRVWLIGASEGIGAALAKALAAAGAQLLLSARNAERLRGLLAELPGAGHCAVPMDVRAPASVAEAWAAVSEAAPDIVLYNAGAYEPMGARAFDLAKAEQMMDVNFHGALRVLSHVLPFFLERQAGHLVLVASVAAYSGLPNAIGYGASKAALLHLAENLQADLDGSAIKVQVVNPGFVKTRLTDKNDFPMPCIITPEEAATAMMRGMASGDFEIHFPKRFTYVLKTLRLLPYRLYFTLLRALL